MAQGLLAIMNTSQTTKNLISAIIAFCVAALIFVGVGYSLNSTVSRVLLTAVFTADTEVHVSDIAKDGRETLIDVINVQANPRSVNMLVLNSLISVLTD